MSSSGGHVPFVGKVQNAGQTPVSAGSKARISKYPYCCANEYCVLMRPEAHLPGPTMSDPARTAVISSAPFCRLNGSIPEAGSTKAESPNPMSATGLMREPGRISDQTVPLPCEMLSELTSSSKVSL